MVAIPIVNDRREIAGWTDVQPKVFGSTLRHTEAERLVGGSIICVYVEIEDSATALQAGAPPGWQGQWRCLALCSARAVSAEANGSVFPVVQIRQHAEL